MLVMFTARQAGGTVDIAQCCPQIVHVTEIANKFRRLLADKIYCAAFQLYI